MCRWCHKHIIQRSKMHCICLAASGSVDAVMVPCVWRRYHRAMYGCKETTCSIPQTPGTMAQCPMPSCAAVSL